MPKLTMKLEQTSDLKDMYFIYKDDQFLDCRTRIEDAETLFDELTEKLRTQPEKKEPVIIKEIEI